MKTSVPKKADKFPLFKHPRGYWAKTVLGKHRYFGKVADDPQGKRALKWWLHDRDYRLAGLEPPAFGNGDPDSDGPRQDCVKYLCNRFIESKDMKVEAGKITQRHFEELKETCKMLLGVIPGSLDVKLLQPVHFNSVLKVINKRYKSPNSRGKFIAQVKAVFSYAYKNKLVSQPVNFGSDFVKPDPVEYQENLNAKGDQSLRADEMHALLKVACVNGRAMILLGLQGGFSNTDLANLPRAAVKGDWIEFPRAKTAVMRRVPLWKETRLAIEAAIKAGKPDGEYVFYQNGVKFDARRHVGYLFQNIARKAGVTGHTFYDLRRSFQTVAENHSEGYDLPAIMHVMGHKPRSGDMPSRYRQNISDDRLLAVTNAVRKWLGKIPKGGAK